MKRLSAQKGFSAIEALIIVIVIAVLCAVGGLVLKNNKSGKKAETNTQTSQTASTEPKTGITSGPGADWNTYTNHEKHFAIQLPKKFLSAYGSQCTQITDTIVVGGNPTSRPHYVAAAGVVPSTIIEDGDDFYITEQYTYQPTSYTSSDNGPNLARACRRVDTSKDTIAGSKEVVPLYQLSLLPFSVVSASSQKDITEWAKTEFKDKTVAVSALTPNANGKWQDVTLDCTSSTPCKAFDSTVFSLRYYAKQHVLVYMILGSTGQLQSADGTTYYDGAVFDSLSLL